MTIALQKAGVEHYANIADVGAFLKVWQDVAAAMKPSPKQIDADKLKEVQATLARMEDEWSGYTKATVTETFRGDTPAVLGSYPWLEAFSKQTQGSTTAVQQQMEFEMNAPIIMSTAKDPTMEYVKPKNIMWHFSLEDGHAGVSEGLYASEGEVTFPLYNRLRVNSVQFVPPGQAYKNQPERFGTAHRYVVNATMLPRR